MADTALFFDNVVKRYKKNVVLDGIDLTVLKGEFLGLVGVNGAGKTTLIKSLLDFCEFDSGEIKIFDISHRFHQSRSNLTFLPERFLPPYYLTGRDFMNYMSRLHGVDLSVEQIEEMFTILDLDTSAMTKSVRDFSKGMAQKLGLAACFLSGKALFVLDEPMSGLDPKARAQLKKHLLLMKSQGVTLFFSTHMLSDVETLCDRIAILHDGQLRFVGTPAECCAKFQSTNLEQAYLNCVEPTINISKH